MVLVLPFYLNRLFTSLRLLLRSMVKRVRHLVSGQCAIARICTDGSRVAEGAQDLPPHTPSMTEAIWREWLHSIRLKPSFEEYARRADMPVDDAVSAICKSKNIELENPCVANLRRCVEDIKGVNRIREVMNTRVNTPFGSGEKAHESSLEKLWQTLLPGQERPGGRYSKEWNRIGFQQADPASDFRGGGILALDQLLYIATTRTAVARNMLVTPADDMSRYPWACVGINLTREVIRVVNGNLLDSRLYGKSVEAGVEVIHNIYADMFEILHHRWVCVNPENVLAFPGVFKSFLKEIDSQLSRTGTLVPPGATA